MGERCGSVANFVKGTIAKIANLPQSLQSNHSPTAILRIHFLQKRLFCHCELCDSKAWQSIKTQKWILGLRLWIATPTSRLAMTEKQEAQEIAFSNHAAGF